MRIAGYKPLILIVHCISIATQWLGLELNAGVTRAAEAQFSRAACMNQRTRFLSGVTNKSTVSGGLVPS